MSNQLLPCPFCGHDEPTHDEGDESAWVQCTNAECGMCGPIASGPSLAAAAWNRRAAQPAAGEALVFANELISGALEGGDFSGADIQELAVKHGLLREERREEACREEGCACAEYGFPTECYRKTAALAPPAAAHGDEAVRFESPEALAKAISDHCGYAEVNSALVAGRIFAAMRAQGDGEVQ